ncbi:GGDEF domain-containing protein [Inmirania thermothiophila]|uniref:GGDEF domain-containing protein n=1 Tax=Inmirania thermothiophila TaxID=1750597 RepID=UPI001473A7D1|nr:sensor domain-containing diguanylate cyclase [Inmirania thermothiophila]
MPRWVLLLWFAVAGVAVVVGAWLWSEQRLREETAHQQHHAAGAYQAYVSGRIGLMHALARSMALAEPMRELAARPTDLRARIRAVAYLQRFVATVGAEGAELLTADGLVLASSDPERVRPGTTHPPRPYLRRALEHGHANWIGTEDGGDELVIHMATALDGGSGKAVLAVLEYPVEMLSGAELAATHPGSVLALLDEYGVVAAGTASSLRLHTLGTLDPTVRARILSESPYGGRLPDPLAVRRRIEHEGAVILELAQRLPELDALHGHDHGDEPEHGAEPGDAEEAHGTDGARAAEAHDDAAAEGGGAAAGGGADHGHRLVVSAAPVPGTRWQTLTLQPVPERWPLFVQSLGFALPLWGVIVLGTLYLVQRARYLRELYERAIRDPLTRLYTRLYMEEAVKVLIEACERRRLQGLAVVLFDIDHFKRVNDTWGHAAGDEVLKAVARVILEDTRPTDVQVRLGGEEMVVWLPEPNLEGAVACAERLRRHVEQMRIATPQGEIAVTVSAGVALRAPGEDMEAAIRRADEALYRAKAEGRNRVVAAPAPAAGSQAAAPV